MHIRQQILLQGGAGKPKKGGKPPGGGAPETQQLIALGGQPTGSREGDIQALLLLQAVNNKKSDNASQTSSLTGTQGVQGAKKAKGARPPMNATTQQLVQAGGRPTGSQSGDEVALQQLIKQHNNYQPPGMQLNFIS